MPATLLSRRNLIAALGLALAAAATPAAVQAAPAGEWVLLGSERVGFRPDRDVIVVGRDEGRFERIMLKVTGNDVHVGDVKVVYGNGQEEHLNVRARIRDGESSGAFHVSGHHRVIDRVELLYQSVQHHRRPATVEVYGQLASVWTDPAPGPYGWRVLGTQSVGFTVDNDTITVGADKGRFRSLKLEVRDFDIFLYSASVTFGNGETQELPAHGLIRGGTSTAALDLSGFRGRRIEKIELVYRTRPGFHGRAHVAVLGRY
jgi:hypothetical protein